MSPTFLAMLMLATSALLPPGSALHRRARRLKHDGVDPNGRYFPSLCKGQKGVAPLMSGERQGLMLIHIPRTGGTTIEDCAKYEPRAEDRWGVEDPALNGHFPIHKAVERSKAQGACYKQHVPPSVIPEVYARQGRETFCVVRDPYDRMLSEFGYRKGVTWTYEHGCTEEGLNDLILSELKETRESPYKADCHLMPQAAWVRGWNAATSEVDLAARSCKHVLRFENFAEDFDRLMEEKALPYRLGGNNTYSAGNTLSPKQCRHLSKANFNSQARRLIEETFKVDFELFGYKKMS